MNRTSPVLVRGDVIATLDNCGGKYECPMNPDGTPKGPLVGYAGPYDGPDGKQLKYVGFVYYNVAKGDQWPHIANHWASEHAKLIAKTECDPDLLIGAPMGGISYMSVLKQHLNCRGIFLEKKVLEAAQEEGGREKSKLILARYEIAPGDRVLLVEDIVNNFSTTENMIRLVEEANAEVVGIACVVNRSDKKIYRKALGRSAIPVAALAHKPTPQYRQDDPAVAPYIAKGQIVWKPKDRWDYLKAIERGETAYA